MQRLPAVLFAAGLGAGLVFAAWWWAPPEPVENDGPRPTLGPTLPPGLDPDQSADSLRDRMRRPVQEARGYRVERLNDRGQLIQFFGDRLEPRAGGRSYLENPRIRYHLGAGRVLQVDAETAHVSAPDNLPRSGRLTGNVHIRLIEQTRAEREAGTADEPDPATGDPAAVPPSSRTTWDLALERADFDLEIGQLTSDGPLTLTGPGFAFTGEGLELIYNELRHRLERLTIRRGERLVLEQTPGEGPFAGPEENGASAGETQPGAAPGDPEADLYRAHFAQRVKLTRDRTTLEADDLELFFPVHRESARPAAKRPEPRATPPRRPAAPGTPPASGPGTETIALTWSGPLELTPAEPGTPRPEAGDTHRAVATGSPVRISLPEGTRASGSRLTWVEPAGRLHLEGSDKWPMRLDSPEMGLIEGGALLLDPGGSRGEVSGAGSLKTRDEAGFLAALDEEAEAPSLAGLEVAWEDRLGFTFTGGTETADLLPPLEEVTFHGEVRATHPRFRLTAGRLALALEPGAEAPAPRKLVATGRARLGEQAHGEPTGLRVGGERITIDLGEDGRPSSFLAEGSALAERPGERLEAGRLRARFAEAPADAGADTDAQEAGPGARFKTLKADRQVRIRIDEPATDVEAERVEVVPGTQAIHLYGTADRPARVVRDPLTLTGLHLRLDEARKTLESEGPGRFTFTRAAGDRPEAAEGTVPEAGVENRPPEAPLTLTTRWTQRMSYDHERARAMFVGAVDSRATRGGESTRLRAERLALLFTRMPESLEQPEAEATDPLAHDGLVLHRMTAQGQASFIGESRQDGPESAVRVRVRIGGERLVFDNLVEQLTSRTPGTILVEDYREQGADPEGGGTGAARFAGPGRTLFRWQASMRLDAFHNEMELVGQAQMRHEPLGDKPAVQLDATRLLADLQNTGGLAVWSRGNAPRPRLRSARAEESVILRSGGRTVTTDLLRYLGAEHVVELVAGEDRLTRVNRRGEAATATARAFRWDLATDRIEITEPAAAR